MGHIHTEPGQHDATSSAYIVFEKEGEDPRLWLHLHKKLGVWLQFGGHVELDETPWQAIVHEIQEESGYEISQLQLLQPALRLDTLIGAKSHPQPVNENTHTFNGLEIRHSHTDRSYAFVTSEMPSLAPEVGESDQMQPMTENEIKALPTATIPESTRAIALFILKDVLSSYDRVDPGIYDL